MEAREELRSSLRYSTAFFLETAVGLVIAEFRLDDRFDLAVEFPLDLLFLVCPRRFFLEMHRERFFFRLIWLTTATLALYPLFLGMSCSDLVLL